MPSKSAILEKLISDDIARGAYPPGSAIPSRNRLCRKYDCSRTTVERAVRNLTGSGFLASRKGSGTFVASAQPGRRIDELRIVGQRDSAGAPIEFIIPEEQLGMPVRWFESKRVLADLDRLSRPGGAVVWIMPGEEQIMMMDILAAKRVPQLLINRDYRDFDYVITDPAASIREGLAWLLIEAGRDIGFITIRPSTRRPYLPARIIAFYESCVELGARLSPSSVYSRNFDDLPREVGEVGLGLFGAGGYPRGIFVMDRDLVMPIIMSAQSYGVQAGRDFRLLTFDRIPELLDRPGVGMMSQPYVRFRREVVRWIKSGAALSEQRFASSLKTEFLTFQPNSPEGGH